MKRLFAYMGLTMLVTLSIVFYFGLQGVVITAVVMLIGYVMTFLSGKLKEHKKAIFIIAITALLSCAYSIGYTTFVFNPTAEKYDGQTVDMKAKLIRQETQVYTCYFYQLETLEVNENPEKLKIMLRSVEELDIDYNDVINCRVILSQVEKDYYKSLGITHTAQAENFYLDYTVDKATHKDIGYAPIWIKDKLIHSINVLMVGNERDLCKAVSLGEKYILNDSIRYNFTKTGMSYLIVVSGLHTSILVSFVMMFTSKLPKRRKYNILRFILSLIFVLLFMSITGFAPSVVRSGIMVLVYSLGTIMGRSKDSLSVLGFSAFLQTIANPYAVADIGMLMSYASVFGIIVMYTPLSEKAKELFSYKKRAGAYLSKEKHSFSEYIRFKMLNFALATVNTILMSISAVTFVSPLTVYFFGTITVTSIWLSIFITPVISVMLICTLISSVLWYIPILSSLSYPIAMVAFVVAKWILNVIKFASLIPFGTFYMDKFYYSIWFSLFIITLLVGYFVNNKKVCRFCGAVVLSVLFILSIFINTLTGVNKTTLTVYPAGSGSTVVLEKNNELYVLSCGGSSANSTDVMYHLHETGETVNLLVVPSTTNSQSRYAPQIMKEFDVKSILLYYISSTNEEAYSIAKECKLTCFEKNETYNVDLDDSFTDIVMNIKGATYQYIHNDEIAVLLLPDNSDCSQLPEKYRSADYVIMSKQPKNVDLLEYSHLIWTDEDNVPQDLSEITVVENEPVVIWK